MFSGIWPKRLLKEAFFVLQLTFSTWPVSCLLTGLLRGSATIAFTKQEFIMSDLCNFFRADWTTVTNDSGASWLAC